VVSVVGTFVFTVGVKNLVRTGAAATAPQTLVNGDKCMVVMNYLRTVMDVSLWLQVLRHLAGRRLCDQSCDSERIEVLLQLLQLMEVQISLQIYVGETERNR